MKLLEWRQTFWATAILGNLHLLVGNKIIGIIFIIISAIAYVISVWSELHDKS